MIDRQNGQFERNGKEERTTGTILQFELTDNERKRLECSYNHLAFPQGTEGNHEPFLRNAFKWFLQFAPPRIVSAINDWRANACSAGVLVIDGFGIDDSLPPTRCDGRRSSQKMTTYSEQVLAAVGQLLGQPIAFANERNGNIIQCLTPVKGKEAALTNEGSKRLDFHSEHAATGFILGQDVSVVDYLCFFGLREDPHDEARTLVSDVRDALAILSPETVWTLRQPEFILRPPYQVRASLPDELKQFSGVPLLRGPVGAPIIRVALYGDLVEGMTQPAVRSIPELREALEAVRREIPTVAGRCVVLDNNVVTHARTESSPAFDGKDRWLQRMMVTTNLRSMAAWQRDSLRVLTPMMELVSE